MTKKKQQYVKPVKCANPSAADVEAASRTWTTADWDSHMTSISRQPAGVARYSLSNSATKAMPVPPNDVIKRVLHALQHGRCWFGGTPSCKSRALSTFEGQIDHIVPKDSNGDSLISALSWSSVQCGYFDVHDPGNLAFICSPCNLIKLDIFPSANYVQHQSLLAEKRRSDVIQKVEAWYKAFSMDDLGAPLSKVHLDNDDEREMYADIIYDMMRNLYQSIYCKEPPTSPWQETSVSIGHWTLEARPSDDAIEAEIESLAEMAADEARAEARFERDN